MTEPADGPVEADPGLLARRGPEIVAGVIASALWGGIASLMKLRPLPVVALAAGVGLLVITKRRYDNPAAAAGSSVRYRAAAATAGLFFAYLSMWLAAYLFGGSL